MPRRDGAIDVTDPLEGVRCVLEAPFVIDANGVRVDLAWTVTQENDGAVVSVLVPEGLAAPIVLDPVGPADVCPWPERRGLARLRCRPASRLDR